MSQKQQPTTSKKARSAARDGTTAPLSVADGLAVGATASPPRTAACRWRWPPLATSSAGTCCASAGTRGWRRPCPGSRSRASPRPGRSRWSTCCRSQRSRRARRPLARHLRARIARPGRTAHHHDLIPPSLGGCVIIDGMPKKSVPPTYVERLLAELEAFELAYKAVLEGSQVRARQMSGDGWVVAGHPWAWVDSTPEIEARRMELLRTLRGWAPRFRLLFPHPTPDVQRRLDDDGIQLLEDWLVRKGKVKHQAPRDIPTGLTRVARACAQLRELAALLPADEWRVRLVVDTNTLLDDPDVTVYRDVIGARYMVHMLPVVLRELDDTKRAGRHQDLRDAAKKADRRLKALRDNGDVRTGARVAGDVYAVFEHIEPRDGGLPDWLDLDVPDDRFVASSLLLQSRHAGSHLYVATNDINLQTKLAAVGLPFVESK
jgi:PIN domain-containing protein